MKIHKRTRIVDQARHEFETFLLDLERKHALTFGDERHDPDRKGDEA